MMLSTSEFIGLNTQIISSFNKELVGMFGVISFETKSMFEIQTSCGMKMIPKQHSAWEFIINNQKYVVDGNVISKRPEDRIKVKL